MRESTLFVSDDGVVESCFVAAGAGSKVGWAFGLGLDRLAMRLYEIPDIRLLWSEDPAFIQQFMVPHPDTPVKFKVTEPRGLIMRIAFPTSMCCIRVKAARTPCHVIGSCQGGGFRLRGGPAPRLSPWDGILWASRLKAERLL